MIELGRKHDLDMEILCSIPPRPGSVMVADLVDDFKLEKQADVSACVDRLNEKGMGIECFNAHNHRALAIRARHWPATKLAALEYWHRNYA